VVELGLACCGIDAEVVQRQECCVRTGKITPSMPVRLSPRTTGGDARFQANRNSIGKYSIMKVMRI
jgi:hypothetical protein